MQAVLVEMGPFFIPDAANVLDVAEKDKKRGLYVGAKGRSKAEIPCLHLRGPLFSKYGICGGLHGREVHDECYGLLRSYISCVYTA